MEESEKTAFKQASWLMGIGGGAFLVARTCLQSPVTYLVLAILFYRHRQNNAAPSAKPLDMHGMVLWYASLDSTMQAAIVTSLITVAGFMLSFYLGTRQWRQQKIADMKLQMSSEIHEFFSVAASSIRKIGLMADHLVELRQLIDFGPKNEEVVTRAHVLATQIKLSARDFEVARSQLMKANIEVHDIRSKHTIPLTSSIIGYLGFVAASKILDEIASLAYFSAPLSPEEQNPEEKLLVGFNTEMAKKFTYLADRKTSQMLGGAAAGKGVAVSSILRPNFWSIAISAFSARQLGGDKALK